MSKGQKKSERYIFRVKSIAVLLTFRDFVVAHDKYISYCIANDISIASYVIEPHQSGNEHTHIVLLTVRPKLYEAYDLHAAFGHYPNVKRLRSTDDAYKAIAYCSKQTTASLTVWGPFSESATKDYILGHVWAYAIKARTKAAREPLMAQYKRMKEEWFPVSVGYDPYNSALVVSEDPSKFFP